MKTIKDALQNTARATGSSEISARPEMAKAIPGSETVARPVKSQRSYQRSLSKHRMKLSRYRLRGSTHKNGMAAMFCVRWLVTASSRADAQAARPIQIRRSDQVGGGPEGTATVRSPC